MLELYHHGTSACAAKVRLALAEKRLDWRGHIVDILAGEQFGAEFLRLNPKAVVPVLEDFMRKGAGEGTAARERKWRWIHEGLAAPGAADQIRLYDAYLGKMETALEAHDWLASERFTMADIALAPYLNRLDALSMQAMWEGGRYPRVEDWFGRVRARPTFAPAIYEWVPEGLRIEMAENGRKSWPAVRGLLAGR